MLWRWENMSCTPSIQIENISKLLMLTRRVKQWISALESNMLIMKVRHVAQWWHNYHAIKLVYYLTQHLINKVVFIKIPTMFKYNKLIISAPVNIFMSVINDVFVLWHVRTSVWYAFIYYQQSEDWRYL